MACRGFFRAPQPGQLVGPCFSACPWLCPPCLPPQVSPWGSETQVLVSVYLPSASPRGPASFLILTLPWEAAGLRGETGGEGARTLPGAGGRASGGRPPGADAALLPSCDTALARALNLELLLLPSQTRAQEALTLRSDGSWGARGIPAASPVPSALCRHSSATSTRPCCRAGPSPGRPLPPSSGGTSQPHQQGGELATGTLWHMPLIIQGALHWGA